jgi:hypothetical protein
MSMRQAGLVVVAAAVATAALAPGTAQAASSTCSAASKARGSRVVVRNKVGVVFTRDPAANPFSEARLRGCTYGGPVFKLTAICCEGQRVRLAGRFLAYSVQGSAEGQETDRLGVYDLKKRKRIKFKKLVPNRGGLGPGEIETAADVPDFAVTSKGSLVWLVDVRTDENRVVEGQYELRAADGPARTERIVDSGKIDPTSLRISRDERTISYRKDGVAKSAPLRS